MMLFDSSLNLMRATLVSSSAVTVALVIAAMRMFRGGNSTAVLPIVMALAMVYFTGYWTIKYFEYTKVQKKPVVMMPVAKPVAKPAGIRPPYVM